MPTSTDVPLAGGNTLNDERIWMNLYRVLLPKAKNWIYNSGVSIWRGQEYDVAWDIVLTAIERTFEYINQAREKGIIVHSPDHLSVVIAKNYYRDLRRRELRLQRFSQGESTQGEQHLLDRLVDPAEEAAEQVYEEWLLIKSASVIAAFSKKLRAAILVDLANRMYFGAEPTVLQQAFLAVGIRLQDYQRSQPCDPVQRGRESALRSLAYKRVAQVVFEMNYSIARRARRKR
jgi:hypothetical protein